MEVESMEGMVLYVEWGSEPESIQGGWGLDRL